MLSVSTALILLVLTATAHSQNPRDPAVQDRLDRLREFRNRPGHTPRTADEILQSIRARYEQRRRSADGQAPGEPEPTEEENAGNSAALRWTPPGQSLDPDDRSEPGSGLTLREAPGTPPHWRVPTASQEVQETFTVNAQFRGAVRKSFTKIGGGTLRYFPLEDGSFRVDGRAIMHNPQDRNITYEFWLDSTYSLDGNRIRLLENLNDFNSESRGFKKRIERALPFVYIAKYSEYPTQEDERPRQYLFKGEPYTIRYARSSRNVEATIYDGTHLVTKIFMPVGSRSPPHEYHKFRVPAPNNVMVSFVIVE